MSISCNDAVGVFVYNDTVRIHTESSYIIFEFLCSVNNFTLVKFICQVGENNSWKLHADTEIHAVRFSRDIKIFTDLFHPFTSASADRYDTFTAVSCAVFGNDTITVIQKFQALYRSVEIEIYMFF